MSAFNLPPGCRLSDIDPPIDDNEDGWFWEEVDRRRDQEAEEELAAELAVEAAQNGEIMPA